jgi:uncharacterized protein
MSEPDETRYFPVVGLDVRDTHRGGFKILEGRAVPFGEWGHVRTNAGEFMERHAPGSFKRSTQQSGRHAPLMLFHDSRSFPIGHAEEWRHDDDGLHGVWSLNDTDAAQTAAALAANGDLRGLSVGFDPLDDRWNDPADWPGGRAPNMDWVTQHQNRLVEVSVTPAPVFTSAEVLAVRSRGPRHPAPPATPHLDRYRAMFDALRSA